MRTIILILSGFGSSQICVGAFCAVRLFFLNSQKHSNIVEVYEYSKGNEFKRLCTQYKAFSALGLSLGFTALMISLGVMSL